jgi:hypothetical protein
MIIEDLTEKAPQFILPIYITNEINLQQKLVIYINIVIIENANESRFFDWH